MLPTARVYKAFNTLGAELMSNPEIGGKPITMMYAGDKDEATKELAGKVSRVGDDCLTHVQDASTLTCLVNTTDPVVRIRAPCT